MALPFLKPRNLVTVLMAKRKPEGGVESTDEPDSSYEGLMAASEQLIKAIDAKDAKAVCEALKDAFTLLDNDDEEESES